MDFKKVSQEEIAEIVGLIEVLSDQNENLIKPLVKKFINLFFENTKELRTIFDGIIDYRVEKDIEAYKKYKEAGINNPDAINLILANKTINNVKFNEYKKDK